MLPEAPNRNVIGTCTPKRPPWANVTGATACAMGTATGAMPCIVALASLSAAKELGQVRNDEHDFAVHVMLIVTSYSHTIYMTAVS